MAPYSACVSSLPTSQRFWEVLMVTQARRSAGTAPAGASTPRASPGRTQSVAAETRTQRAGGRDAAEAIGDALCEAPAAGPLEAPAACAPSPAHASMARASTGAARLSL